MYFYFLESSKVIYFWQHCSKVLRYGAHSQGISQFYLHILRSSANGMNQTVPAFSFPAEADPHLPTPVPGTEPGHGNSSKY